MSDGIVFLLVIVAALGLLYVWLRGWWFAGVVVALAIFAAVMPTHGWTVAVWAGLLGFVPWGAWKSFTPAGREVWAGIAADPRQTSARLPHMRPSRRQRQEALALARSFHLRGWTFLRGTGTPEIEAEMDRLGLFGPPVDVDCSCSQAMTDALPNSGVPMPLAPSRAKPQNPRGMWHQGHPALMQLDGELNRR